ncbi:MAG: NTF2 fold immunity protein [Panacagrimonas sp.]
MHLAATALLVCTSLLASLTSLWAAPAVDTPGPIAKAPSWVLFTPEGARVSYPADAGGQPTVLMFWPSWCPFSRALQPYVQDIWLDYRDRGVKVWTINIKEDGDPVQTLRDRGLSFPLLLKGDALMAPYQITRTPWLVVMDGAQNILYTRPANPPTPIDVAKRVRAVLNQLLGERAVPLPSTYPPPYDLHLKKVEDLPDRRAPKEIAESQWEPWARAYLATIPADEGRRDLPAQGAIASGKAAITLAKQLWTQTYGVEQVQAMAPYRAFRIDQRWIVLGQGVDGDLGSGLILVIEQDSGQVVRMRRASD